MESSSLTVRPPPGLEITALETSDVLPPPTTKTTSGAERLGKQTSGAVQKSVALFSTFSVAVAVSQSVSRGSHLYLLVESVTSEIEMTPEKRFLNGDFQRRKADFKAN